MSSIGLARRSAPVCPARPSLITRANMQTSEVAARQLDALIEKLASDDGAELLGGLHKRLLGLDSLTGALGQPGQGHHGH